MKDIRLIRNGKPFKLNHLFRLVFMLPLASALLIAGYVFMNKNINILTNLTNGFFVIGILNLCYSSYVYVYNIMMFKTFGYALYKIKLGAFFRKPTGVGIMSFHEYIEEFDQPRYKKDGVPYCICGSVLVAVSLVLTVLHYLQ